MKRSVKRVIFTAAALSALTATTAMAGTVGCFQNQKAGAKITDFGAAYIGADCGGLVPPAAAIAYEMTGGTNGLTLNLGAIGSGLTPVETIVYTPTTDIPQGSRITMTLSGATWKELGNLFLIKDGSYNATNADAVSVASTDGATNGVASITFVVKNGVTIAAGTPLILSTTDITGTALSNYTTPSILIKNSACQPAASTVTIAVTSALTDGGSTLAGGLTAATALIDISQQFAEFVGAAAPATAYVDVETPSLRTLFVKNLVTSGIDIAQTTQVPYAAIFSDNINNLDMRIVIAASDTVQAKFIASNSIDSFMKVNLLDVAADGVAGANDTFSIPINSVGQASPFSVTTSATPTVYTFDATKFYHPANVGSLDTPDVVGTIGTKFNNTVYINLTNTDLTSKPMPYNYNVTTAVKLAFDTAINPTYISHCEVAQKTHDISINGSVLKVPYMIATDSAFLRISNEDSSDALVFGDFQEGGTVCSNVPFGTVAANASVIIKGDAMLNAMTAAGGNCATLATNIPANLATRFFATFTITAPKDKVHGYGVQKIAGGVDRVLTVLDQNAWIQ